ncbi:MAG: PHP domain-containing protein [Nitrososphaeria archaeon]
MPKLLEYRFDLHTHTTCSFDSITSPKQLVKAAVREGLSGLAVTDHNSVECIAQVKRAAGENLTVISGIECKTRHGDLIGLFVSERPLGSNILEIADQIKEMNGLVVLPHPISYFRKNIYSRQEMEVIRKVDAIETFNARNVFGRLNREGERLAAKFSKTRVGGSDAHTLREVGRGYTVFACGEEDEVRKAILSGETDVGGSLSPFIVRVHSIAARIRKRRLSPD